MQCSLMLFPLFDSNLEFSPLPNSQNLFQSPAPTFFQLFLTFRPAITSYSSVLLSYSRPREQRDVPTIPHPLVLGILNGSVSHSQPQFNPTHPSHIRYDLYLLCPCSKPASKFPSGEWGCWGGLYVACMNWESHLCRQQGRER
jgi:hypothetical protein